MRWVKSIRFSRPFFSPSSVLHTWIQTQSRNVFKCKTDFWICQNSYFLLQFLPNLHGFLLQLLHSLWASQPRKVSKVQKQPAKWTNHCFWFCDFYRLMFHICGTLEAFGFSTFSPFKTTNLSCLEYTKTKYGVNVMWGVKEAGFSIHPPLSRHLFLLSSTRFCTSFFRFCLGFSFRYCITCAFSFLNHPVVVLAEHLGLLSSLSSL